jgi:hypothetical protein
MTDPTTCTCGAHEELARVREQLAQANAKAERLFRQVRDEERENDALRRRLRVGGR